LSNESNRGGDISGIIFKTSLGPLKNSGGLPFSNSISVIPNDQISAHLKSLTLLKNN
jgi:hypothetical protein